MSNTLDQIYNKIKVDANGCWIWTGAVDRDGYALIHYKGQRYQGHIFLWNQFREAIPEGYELDHKCGVRACLNWQFHLEPVTKLENLRRAGKYKLSDEQIQEIRDIPGHVSNVTVAEIYSVTPQLVSMIRRGIHR